jgi:uncharacterized membrane protein
MTVGVAVLWASSRASIRQREKRRPDMPTLAAGRGVHVERTVTVRAPAVAVYDEWRDLQRLPRLLPSHIVSVVPAGPGRTRWTIAGPAGVTARWDAELSADEPGRLLAWRSLSDGDVDIAGSVRFSPAPGERGTEVKVILTYAPPGGKVGAAAAALLGRGGDRLVREALRRFKQLVETGEITEAVSTVPADRAVRSA